MDRSGGFFQGFRDDGSIFDAERRHLVSSARFVINHSVLYRLLKRPEDLAAVRHGLAFLHDVHAAPAGGFAWELRWRDGRSEVLDATQQNYGAAFVLLAHAEAMMAGVSEARGGLDAAYDLMEKHFWEPAAQLYADEAAADWSTVGSYRGQNSNMHSCEAMMAAFDATGEAKFLARALVLARGITQRLPAIVGSGLVWEHYTEAWKPDLEYGKATQGRAGNKFRPWGYQTGHLTEWSKLLLQLEAHLGSAAGKAACPGAAEEAAAWLLPTARRFFDAAWERGWDAVHGGLVYGFSPEDDGWSVCDADKYFWVQVGCAARCSGELLLSALGSAPAYKPYARLPLSLSLPPPLPQCESIGAASLLAARTGEKKYADAYDALWAYAWAHFIDHKNGAWYRILAPDNSKVTDEKSPVGKTDYHVICGACRDVLRGMGEIL